jgi:Flp pilus assembly protein TadD
MDYYKPLVDDDSVMDILATSRRGPRKRPPSRSREKMLKKFICHPLCHVLLILLLGSLAYANSLRVPFFIDDFESIANNEIIRDLGNFLPGGSGWEFLPRRVVGYFTFALNYRFGGLDVTGYHLFNLAVHLSTALAVYALVRLTYRSPRLAGSTLVPQAGTVALLAALFFVAHPLQTQAVTYIVQRLASLCTLFYLLSLVLYAAARLRFETLPLTVRGGSGLIPERCRAPLLLTGSVVAALLAMGTKEIAFTLPLVVLLYEASFFRGKWLRRMLYLLPLLLTLPLIPWSILTSDAVNPLASGFEEQLRAHTDLPRLHYLFTQIRVIVTYLRLLILPTGQNVDYDYPVFTSFFTPPVFLSFLLLAALFSLALCLYGFRSRDSDDAQGTTGDYRLVAFGIVWFFLTLSVESGVVPLADVIFEHRLYLPSIGLFVALAVFIVLGAEKAPSLYLARLALPAAMLAIALLTVATWQRNRIWRSEVSLWTDAARKSPAKGRPWYNLGTALIGAGEPEAALPPLQQALKLDPENAEAWHNLGRTYLMLAQYNKALYPLRQSVKLDSELDNAVVNLSIALIYVNQPREAVFRLEQIREKHPELPYVRYNLGLAYLGTGELTLARRELTALNRIAPEAAASLASQIDQAAARFKTP